MLVLLTKRRFYALVLALLLTLVACSSPPGGGGGGGNGTSAPEYVEAGIVIYDNEIRVAGAEALSAPLQADLEQAYLDWLGDPLLRLERYLAGEVGTQELPLGYQVLVKAFWKGVSGAEGYRVYLRNSGGSPVELASLPATQTEWTITDIMPQFEIEDGSTYEVGVAVVKGGQSGEITWSWPLGALGAVTMTAPEAGSSQPNRPNFAWVNARGNPAAAELDVFDASGKPVLVQAFVSLPLPSSATATQSLPDGTYSWVVLNAGSSQATVDSRTSTYFNQGYMVMSLPDFRSFTVGSGGGGGGGGGSNDSISGTVTAPAGGDVSGTLVVACFPSGQSCDQQKTKTTTISQSGGSASYSIGGLEAGQYIMLAQKDVNGNGQIDTGDYFGQNTSSTTPPAEGINISMQVVGGGGGGGGGGNDSISGTVFAPPSGDVSGSVVFACVVEGNQPNCDSPKSKSSQITQSGSSASYTISGLASGSYGLFAIKDIDGNGKIEDGDYNGCFGNDQSCTPVSPPATGKDIEMTVVGGSGGGGGGGGGGGNGSVTILRPADFQGGQATVTLSGLGTNESVAVIPVYATQDASPDGFSYTLSVQGISAQAAIAPQAAPELSPQEARRLELHRNHVEFLEESLELVEELQRSGVQPLGQGNGVQTQAFDKCPPPYTVGSKQCQFWVGGFGDPQQITATLQLESDNAYWFVQNEDLGDFSATELQGLAQAFEQITVPSNTRYFGDFSDVDQNGKIIIVFSRLLTGGLLGYVAPWDYFPDSVTFPQIGQHSNEGDIFYATTPSEFEKGGASRQLYFSATMPATITHELKHLIASGIRILNDRPGEELWIEEPSAQAAQELAGQGTTLNEAQGAARFGLAAPQDFRIVYEGRPSSREENLSIYGYNFLLMWRIAEAVGHDNFWKVWTAGPGKGVANLEAHAGKPFDELMLDWAPALMFDDTGLVQGYDYQSLNLRDGSWQNLGYRPLTNTEGTARSMAYYVGKGTGSDASITIQTNHPKPYAIVIRFSGSLPWGPSSGGGGGGGGGNDNSISGTVFAPPGGDVSGTQVDICFVEGNQAKCGSPNSQSVQISQSGASASFSVSGLNDGSYAVFGWKDINGNGQIDDGDYDGCYSSDQGCLVVTPPKQGADVQMAVRGSGGGGGGGGGGGNSGDGISGTLSAPAGGDVKNSFVVISTKTSNQAAKLVTASGASTPYEIDVPPGAYQAWAYKDINSDGVLNNGDYYGCYADCGLSLPISPPQSKVDIEMLAITNASTLPTELRGRLEGVMQQRYWLERLHLPAWPYLFIPPSHE